MHLLLCETVEIGVHRSDFRGVCKWMTCIFHFQSPWRFTEMR